MEQTTVNKDPILWIQNEYYRRKDADSGYSTRAFAKSLGVSSGRLSELFSGKRNLTLKLGERFVESIGMDPQTEAEFKEAILSEKKNRNNKTRLYNNLKKDDDLHYKKLSQDIYHLISKQQYFAILNMMKTKNFRWCATWIGNRLEIPSVTVEQAIKLMLRIGILEEKDGDYIRVNKKYKTTDDIESRAIKMAHREKLQHALVSLETVSVELRDITSITCPIDKSKIPQVKELIKEFRRGLVQFMEDGDCDEVYNINIQLVPLTKVEQTNSAQTLH